MFSVCASNLTIQVVIPSHWKENNQFSEVSPACMRLKHNILLHIQKIQTFCGSCGTSLSMFSISSEVSQLLQTQFELLGYYNLLLL